MLATSHAVLRAQSQRQNPADSLPSAPQPKLVVKDKSKVGPCRVIPSQTQAGSVVVSVAAQQVIANAGLELVAHGHEASSLSQAADLPPCPPAPLIDWFARFLNGPEVKPLTPKEKARLALRNLLDPFNAVTILGTSGIAVAADGLGRRLGRLAVAVRRFEIGIERLDLVLWRRLGRGRLARPVLLVARNYRCLRRAGPGLRFRHVGLRLARRRRFG